ncbi:cell envelope-associated transcriptional attenuator LytR-CpsA-Psr [Liquorilactobacillus sucicola DSM 21376 = JCM 15457]|uniref:LytR family transcriptional regulator n=1 Tax=Liquorilactobacillus sucicola DSM 21376 = JCM 15457 TaxID=1423806 RepID=A0A023CVI8_9LACO|nr:LCP family protein [Liquorilactobacillus sucicola]KRN05908.1 LytR family transcriptional regulator [Liquorilactobacillus sucicola DSM 21376 = JCM 15457]GAJ25814.1 cell envelope-associated transcriptional attenuator LytR-CpsA-Psr [Liquorilactobacillus sucicola DSM 21376 = JCM 15457]
MNNNDKNSEELIDTPMRRNNGSSHRKKSPRGKRRLTCTILLGLILILFYGTAFYAYNMLGVAKDTISKTFKQTNIKKSRNVSQVLKDKKPFSVLLLGTDTGDLGRSDKGRTDTIILATVNPQTKRATLTSIPRDTQVKIKDSENSYDKINSAYTIGGTKSAVETVQNTLHVPIDFYLLVNMGGLRKVVDALGGVTVTPQLTFKYSYADVTKGKTVKLNGQEALAYSRMRYSDPEGDYGRQKRQKQIIKAIASKAASSASLANYKKILATIEDNMQTDMTYDDMITIETNYKEAANSMKSDVLQGSDAMLSGVSYQIVSAKEKQKVSDRIRSELNLKPSTEEFYGQVNENYSNNTYSSNGGSYSDNDSSSTINGSDNGSSYSDGNSYSNNSTYTPAYSTSSYSNGY